jgi:biotin operon repressor
MSFHAIHWALKQNINHPTTKLLLIMLSNYANERNECYPSQVHLAKKCGCSERSIITHSKKLEKLGMIKISKVRKGIKLHNIYKLMAGRPPEKLADNTNINKIKNKNFLAG